MDTILPRSGSLKEASHYFRQCLAVQPHYLEALRNLENVSNHLVERWHFRMLNDEHRNDAFREAIIKKIKQGFDKTLDIGTGTGILSLFMLEGKAAKIYACDTSSAMVDIATQVFKSNDAEDRIKLFHKSSNELAIPQDIPAKVSMIATEILDAGLFGEHVLETLTHAWEYLLLPPAPNASAVTKPNQFGVVIPFGATIFIAGIECDIISKRFYARNHKSLKFSFVDCNLVQNENNYDTEDLKSVRGGFKCLTDIKPVLHVNFNDPIMLKDMLDGKHDLELKLRCVTSGRLDCLAVWFDLRLDEDIVLNTGPSSRVNNCWDQAIFPLPHHMNLDIDQEIKHQVSFSKGKLAIRSNDMTCIEQNISYLLVEDRQTFVPSEEVIQTINNDHLIEVLEDTRGLLEDKYECPVKILDAFPFPVFGLNFVIGRRDRVKDHLTCVVPTGNDKNLVEFIAIQNNIEDRVTCVLEEDLEDVLENVTGFDILLFNVVDLTGELRSKVMSQCKHLKSCIKPNSIILPEEIIVMGQFVKSDWLERMSKVINNDVTCGYSVADFINEYQVGHHIDFDSSSIEKVILSDEFVLCDVSDSERSLSELSVRVTSPGKTNALIYWFDICFLKGCRRMSTLNNNSSYRQAALLFPNHETNEHIKFHVIQENGLLEIRIHEEK